MARNLGMVTAYAYAVAGGYTGTEAEFEELLGNIADDLSQIENLSVTVTTLTPGSSATASYSNGVLALGIPRGNTGATGNGISAIIKTGTSGLVDTYTVTYTNGQTMTYTVTNGAKGDTGNGIASIALTSTSGAVKTYTVTFTDGSTFTFDVTDGEVTNASLAEAFEDFSANGTVANAEQLTTDIRANDQTPYLFRTAGGSVDIGDREYINGIVGGTVVWNQLRTDSISTSTADGITTSYSNGKFSITNDSRSTNYSSGSTRTEIANGIIQGHKYIVLGYSPKSLVGVVVSWTTTSDSLGVADINSVFSASNVSNTNKAVHLRLTNQYDFVTTHPVGDVTTFTLNLIDLTQMFGSTIADYIYSLEQATAGAGVAFFKTLFPKPYYAYNAGELKSVSGLVSHDMTGFNQFDKSTITANTWIDNSSTGATASVNGYHLSAFIPVIPNTTYYHSATGTIRGLQYDANKNIVDTNGWGTSGSEAVTFTTRENAHYVRFTVTSGNLDTFVFNLSWDGSRDGEYEPYQKWSYPLDSDLELRGIPKIENGNLYYDGDTYESDGTVTRKYGVVDLGTLTWTYNDGLHLLLAEISGLKNVASSVVGNIVCSQYPTGKYIDLYDNRANKTIATRSGATQGVAVYDTAYTDGATFKASVSGVYLVYELATPTTESADPYTSPQIVSDFGTEEYVIDDDVFAIPVGHNTDYPINLKAKVEMAPNSPDGDGDYIVRQTNGTNEYVSIANNATIQNILARLEALEG